MAARNLPKITSASRTGMVMRSSMVPLRRSSASRPIVMAGTANASMMPSRRNISRTEAWFIRKKGVQKKKPSAKSTMQMTM